MFKVKMHINKGINRWIYILNNKLHRENGPAIEYEDGSCRYFIDGNNCSQEQFEWVVDRGLIPHKKR